MVLSPSHSTFPNLGNEPAFGGGASGGFPVFSCVVGGADGGGGACAASVPAVEPVFVVDGGGGGGGGGGKPELPAGGRGLRVLPPSSSRLLASPSAKYASMSSRLVAARAGLGRRGPACIGGGPGRDVGVVAGKREEGAAPEPGMSRGGTRKSGVWLGGGGVMVVIGGASMCEGRCKLALLVGRSLSWERRADSKSVSPGPCGGSSSEAGMRWSAPKPRMQPRAPVPPQVRDGWMVTRRVTLYSWLYT